MNSRWFRNASIYCVFTLVTFGIQAETPSKAVPGADYLSAGLRAKVEQLKADVAREPTDFETVHARARVLWEWGNAFAKNGGVLPVELPLVSALILSIPLSENPISLDPMVYLDRFVRELQVRDEQPNAIGTLTSPVMGPFPAESYQTIEQTYTLGEMPMVPGGGVLLARQFLSDHGLYQTDDPAADNHVTIHSSNPEARFVRESASLAGMHGGFYRAIDTLVFRLEGVSLQKGDTVTITYGDRSGGSKGFLIQTSSTDGASFPLYVDLEGKGNFFTLPLQLHQVIGKEVYSVHGFAPSVTAVGERFTLSVRSEDYYYNRATGPIPAYDVIVNGKPFTTIPAGNDAITLLSDLKFEEPGVYRFEFRSPDGKITGHTNPVWVQEDPTQRIYWGETHGHSGFAEGVGTPDGFFRFGRDDARLDFLTHSEHDLWLDDREWEILRENVQRFNEEGVFIAILGYEWTVTTRRGGHHIVFFRTPEDRRRVPIQTAPVLSQLYQRLREENDPDDVLIIPHAHMAGEWRMSEPDMQKLVEIMSQHGTFEWFGNMYLKRGSQMGFIAASDDHLGHPGYSGTISQRRGLFQRGGLAAVLAPEKTSDAIFDALRNLSTYATTGERIIIEIELNGAPMGTRTKFASERRIRGRVMGTAPIDTITIIKNGEEIWSRDFLTVVDGKSAWVQLNFWSSSKPLTRDNPRGIRFWNGVLDVKGARLVGVSAPGMQNRYFARTAMDPEVPNRVTFDTATRGRISTILLELEGITSETAIEVKLEPGTEYSGTLFRPRAKIPGAEVTLAFKDLDDGKVTQVLQVDRYRDTLTLRQINPGVPLDREFEFVDTEYPNHGDYYYVRVKQLDNAMAWTSPIWVGGFPTR